MSVIKVVIGDRMGKGQKVGSGAQAAGAEVTVIPGMAADMKLGDVMHQQQADLGISFCRQRRRRCYHSANKIWLSMPLWNALC